MWLASGHHTANGLAASASVNGRSIRMPALWAMTPASHGSAAPPTVDAEFITPMAVGVSRAWVSCGAIAIVVGKIGPRQKPSSNSAALAPAATGDSQASVVATATPVRQAYI